MTILYRDEAVAVCVKPAGVLSTDEAGGMPELLRAALGVSDVRSVHRLDRVVSGLMVYALSAEAAAALSRSVREGTFQKEYLGVIHFRPHEDAGTFRDLLRRDPVERKTKVVKEAGKESGAVAGKVTYPFPPDELLSILQTIYCAEDEEGS